MRGTATPPLTLDLGLLLPSLASEASVPLWASLQDHARSFSLSDPAPGSWCRIVPMPVRLRGLEAARTVTLSQVGRATLLSFDANVHRMDWNAACSVLAVALAFQDGVAQSMSWSHTRKAAILILFVHYSILYLPM